VIDGEKMQLFENMDQDSRLWIFMAEEPFTDELIHLIRTELKTHMESWHAHGKSLTTDYSIEYNQFILLAVDEKKVVASGCSIDSSFRFIMSLETKFKISLLNRNLLAYLKDETVHLIKRSDFKEAIKNKIISEETFVFDNTIDRLSKLKNWISPVKNSWFYDAFFV
jgi:hypothetical protein